LNSLGKTDTYRPVPPKENSTSNDISIDEQTQIDRISYKVDLIINSLLGKAIEQKDVPMFEWIGDGFKKNES
jgi:hypothetical protein